MRNNIKEKKAVLNFAYNFEDVVRRKNWIGRYEADTDSFMVGAKKLSSDARLKYFGDEFAFYITKGGVIEGIFVEYFKKNFIRHNKEIDEIRGILSKMESGRKKNNSLIELKGSQLKTKLIKGLEDAMETSLAETLNLEPCSC